MARSRVFPTLRPPTELAAPARLKWEVAARLMLLDREGAAHPFLREDPKAWAKRNRDLARAAATGDADALIKLCGRDPRYLASELFITTWFAWKLRLLWSDFKGKVPVRRKPMTPAELAAQAKRKGKIEKERRAIDGKVKRLQSTLAPGTGRGMKRFRITALMKSEYRSVLKRAMNASRIITSSKVHTTTKIARDVSLEDREQIVRLLIGGKHRPPGAVQIVLAKEYGLSVNRYRVMIASRPKKRVP